MIIVITRYKVKPGTRQLVLAIAGQSRERARKLEGNIEYMAMPSALEDEIISIEQWEKKSQLEAYCESENCKIFIANRAPYLVQGSKTTEIYEADATTINVSIPLK